MSPEAAQKGRGAPRFPRVSGDEPDTHVAVTVFGEFSPFERG